MFVNSQNVFTPRPRLEIAAKEATMPCITTNSTLSVETLDDSSGTTYFLVVSTTSPIKITFACSGTIDNITIDPSPPRAVGNSITFTSDDIDQTFTVTVDYTPPPTLRDDPVHPLETPTKVPKFKPVITCPS